MKLIRFATSAALLLAFGTASAATKCNAGGCWEVTVGMVRIENGHMYLAMDPAPTSDATSVLAPVISDATKCKPKNVYFQKPSATSVQGTYRSLAMRVTDDTFDATFKTLQTAQLLGKTVAVAFSGAAGTDCMITSITVDMSR